MIHFYDVRNFFNKRKHKNVNKSEKSAHYEYIDSATTVLIGSLRLIYWLDLRLKKPQGKKN